jgi:peptide subunit release factor 1 (eRF1)
MDMNASEMEVLNKSWAVVEEAQASEHAALTEHVITLAAKAEGAAVGLADTLAALQEERAHTLLIAEGFSAPGYRCTQCGYLTPARQDSCPLCGGMLVQVDDAVEYAVKRMLELGDQVESIRDSSALVEAGSIGALLRY